MNYKGVIFLCTLFLWSFSGYSQHYKLIAHRGGVVDSLRAENSREALQEAIRRGYDMIETDVRMTKDSFLVTHHDASLKRTFGIDKPLSALTWKELRVLKNENGYRILSLEEVLQQAKGHLQIMIDLKIPGYHPAVFNKMIHLLKKYDLYQGALMIGTDESTVFFTGKIKLSCTREQLTSNMQQPHYSAADYYLFSGDISAADAAWAKEHHILAIGVINAWTFDKANGAQLAAEQAQRLMDAGLTWFQIDSMFERFFKSR
jgi:glycerophosphoryl diester phosphodiesterase